MNDQAMIVTQGKAPEVTARGMPPAWVVVVVLIVVGVLVNFWRLGEGPIVGTEPHRVIPGHEMAQGGTWVAQKLLDRWYMTKPPGMAWVMAAAERLTGESNPWVWRSPGALAGVALPLMLWFMLRRWAGDGAGLGAGLGALALITLWSQNKSAETDGVLTLFSTIGALAAMHVGLNPQQRWHLGAGFAGCIAFTATMMLKGPVTLPVWIGAVIGTAWATGRWRWIGRPAVWIGLPLGAIAMVWWGAAMKAEMARRGVPLDYFGVENFRDRLTVVNLWVVLRSLAMPARLIAYAMPVSALLLLAPWRKSEAGAVSRITTITRAGAIGFGIAVAIYSLARIQVPRYGYPAMPLLAIVAGGVAQAWRIGGYTEIQVKRLRQLLTGVTATLACMAIGLAAIAWGGSTHRTELVVAISSAAAIGGWGVIAWVKQNVRSGLFAATMLLPVVAIPFADFEKTQNHWQKSSYRSGVMLREIVGGDDTTVLAAWIAVHQPELLWYAGVRHKWISYKLEEAFGAGWRGWVVMNEEEWKRWSVSSPERFTRFHPLPQPRGTVLAWHEPVPAK